MKNAELETRNAESVVNSEFGTRSGEWMTVRLGDVVEIDRVGIDGSRLELNQRYLGLEHLDSDGKIRWGETVESAGVKSSKFRFTRKHVLFGKLRPYLRKVVRPEQDGVCSTDILPLLPKSGVDRDFIYHLLRTDENTRRATEACSGANLPRLSPGKFRAFEFRVPRSLAAQRRIAGILDAADRLRTQRRETLAQLDTLLQSTFLELFGDPVTNPKGWEVKKFSETHSKVQIEPFGSLLHKEDYIAGGVPLVNPMHIINGRIVTGDQTVLESKAAQLSNYRLRVDDVVMGRRGEMGRCAIVSAIEAGMLCGTGSLYIRPDAGEFASLFLASLLSCGSMKRHLESLSQGVTMPNLNRTMIEKLKVPLPPIALQRRFAAIVESVEKQKTRKRAHLAELDALFASLQSRAFNGEL